MEDLRSREEDACRGGEKAESFSAPTMEQWTLDKATVSTSVKGPRTISRRGREDAAAVRTASGP